MRLYVAAGRRTPTNRALARALCERGVDASVVSPEALMRRVAPGDTILGRVDVLPSLDGVESCIWQLRRVESFGVRILNDVACLLGAHDKLHTALRLGRAGLPHPQTAHLQDPASRVDLEFPVVLKPRFGSWGKDVVLCETRASFERTLRQLRGRRWLRRQGVIVQELVPPVGRDLRVLVAGGEVIGAIERRAAPGEWRTNVALGGTRHPTVPPDEAAELALAAARAVGGDLVGVDLLPHGDGWVVLELNAAVDFTDDYSFPGRDIFADAADRLLSAVAGTPVRDVAGVA